MLISSDRFGDVEIDGAEDRPRFVFEVILLVEPRPGADRVLDPWVRGGLALRAESLLGGGS